MYLFCGLSLTVEHNNCTGSNVISLLFQVLDHQTSAYPCRTSSPEISSRRISSLTPSSSGFSSLVLASSPESYVLQETLAWSPSSSKQLQHRKNTQQSGVNIELGQKTKFLCWKLVVNSACRFSKWLEEIRGCDTHCTEDYSIYENAHKLSMLIVNSAKSSQL